MNYLLQRVSFAGLACRSFYCIPRRGIVECSLERLKLGAGAEVSFCAFANIIDLDYWRGKSVAKDFSITLRGSGRLTLQACVIQEGGVLEIQSWNTNLFDASIAEVLNFDGELPFSGGLFFVVRADTDVELYSVDFGTNVEPPNALKLGVVITHYRREINVYSCIEKIQDLINKFNLQCNLEVVVVDNSRTLELKSTELLHIIENKNLGGAGGFARGLIHLKNNGFTHALFMDDDALSDSDVLYKTIAMLAYSKVDNLSILGTLFELSNTTKIIESGGGWVHGPVSANANLDVSNLKDIQSFITSNRSPCYGAWWYFAFPLKVVSHYPYPFFVRGDDQLFGFQNDFANYSPIGVYAFGEKFALKESALTKYLSTRSIFALHIYKKSRFFKIIKFLIKSQLSCLLTCNYNSAKAVTVAIKHVCMGGDAFARNENPLESKELSEYLSGESVGYVPNSIPNISDDKSQHCNFKKILFVLTLGGLLIPGFMFNKESWLHKEKKYRDPFSGFPSKYLIFYGGVKGLEISAYSKQKLVIGAFDFMFSLFVLMFNYGAVKKSFLISFEKLTEESYWNEVFTSR